MFKKITLDNGLRIITAPMQGTNTVTILVMCGTGSDYETTTENGLSHFLEHMFFKGTTNRPNADVIRKELDGMGSISNAFTDHETTGYFIKAGTPYLDRSLDILADIYRNSLFETGEIEREKQVVVEEMHLRRDTASTHIWDLWDTYLYPGQPAGRDVAGDEASVRALRKDDLVRYFNHQYVCGNTAIVVAGNIDETKTVERITKLFGDVRDETPREKPAVHEEQSSPSLHIETKATDQTNVIVGFRGFDVFHPRRDAMNVLAALLGGAWSSRMFSKIREELGLAYNVYSSNENYSNRGYFVTYAGVAHENLLKTIQAILEEYRKVRDGGVLPEELGRIKDFIKGRMLMSVETSNAVSSFIASEEMLTGRPLTIDEVFASIDAVSEHDIAVSARELFLVNRLNVAVLGPSPDTARIQSMLEMYR